MRTDPRAALDRLMAAFEAHLAASAGRRGEQDSAVEVAYRQLADAFEAYDDVLYRVFGEATPFVLYDDVEDELDDDGDLIDDEDDRDDDDPTVSDTTDLDELDIDDLDDDFDDYEVLTPTAPGHLSTETSSRA